ncbi:MAG: 4-hydroxybenzoate polyprenyltransferase [Flavobacteriaceae bacterium]|jgi:4-hydroxybenzoate polyprenyltransferase|uniref:geranylgeranylglycerol-phosphate geranylgeranyltransferase n=1 Tax=Candidatus Marifrigoribacter sp. Uisw_064 TaxID=3230970 RepID=UPI003AE2A08F
MAFLKLIRIQNLLLIACMQYLVKYSLFHPFGVSTTLSNFEFILLVIATVCIAAGGNIINDINDVSIDLINKPHKVFVGKSISEKIAHTLYLILTIIGVGLGFYLSNSLGKPGFAAIFIIISALLYIYATYLKSILLIGNIVISFLVSLSIIIVALFDLMPSTTLSNQSMQSIVFRIVLEYAFFAFLINFIREIVKDIQDIDGDKNGDINSLPITIGRKRAGFIVFGLGILTVLIVLLYMYTHLYNIQLAMLYFLFFIVAPLLYFCIKSWTAETKKELAFLSGLLKLIMFFGICSILLYKYVIIN